MASSRPTCVPGWPAWKRPIWPMWRSAARMGWRRSWLRLMPRWPAAFRPWPSWALRPATCASSESRRATAARRPCSKIFYRALALMRNGAISPRSKARATWACTCALARCRSANWCASPCPHSAAAMRAHGCGWPSWCGASFMCKFWPTSRTSRRAHSNPTTTRFSGTRMSWHSSALPPGAPGVPATRWWTQPCCN